MLIKNKLGFIISLRRNHLSSEPAISEPSIIAEINPQTKGHIRTLAEFEVANPARVNT